MIYYQFLHKFLYSYVKFLNNLYNLENSLKIPQEFKPRYLLLLSLPYPDISPVAEIQIT